MAEATISHLIQTMQENSDNSDKLQRSNRYQLKKIAGLTKNFIDEFDNFHVNWWDRTASKRAIEVVDSALKSFTHVL